jgi:hypothetical protein
MRKFKHKTTGYISTETNSEKNYKVSEPKNFTIPKWIVENSGDWEEIKEFPKIISLQHIDTLEIITDKVDIEAFLEGYGIRFWQIYQVAVSETEVFTLGDKLDKWEANIIRFDYNNGIIRVISDAKGKGLVASEVSWELKNCKKAPEVLFTLEQERYIIDLICKYK